MIKLRIGIVMLLTLLLAACGHSAKNNLNPNVLQETWQQQVENDPRVWVKGASPWFVAGRNESGAEKMIQVEPSRALSHLNITLPGFVNITINGAFHVEIMGADHESVEIVGPNEAVRQTYAAVRNQTLFLTQAAHAVPAISQVTVRISVNNLQQLTQLGCGQVEAINLRSDNLTVRALPTSTGHMFLSGDMQLNQIYHAGNGQITIFGAHSSGLNITTLSKGDVNVSGRIALNCIVHHGANRIRVIGARAGGEATVIADGSGCVTINGDINLKSVQASGQVGVYAYMLRSKALTIHAAQNAKVGVAGIANSVYANVENNAYFFGRNLCARVAYVRTNQNAHANIFATERVFAAATGNSTIYFYGVPEIMSQFISGHSNIIPVWNDGYQSCRWLRAGSLKGESAAMPRKRLHAHRHLKGE